MSRDRDPSLSVTWGLTSVQVSGTSAEVIMRITSTFGSHNDVEVWRFSVSRQNGWRVCDANRDPSLEP
jgi:hypothetical protein